MIPLKYQRYLGSITLKDNLVSLLSNTKEVSIILIKQNFLIKFKIFALLQHERNKMLRVF